MWLFFPTSAKNHFLWLTLTWCHCVRQKAYMRQPAVIPHPPSQTAWCGWYTHSWTGPFPGWRLLVSVLTPDVEAIPKLWINTSPWDHHPSIHKFQICWHRKNHFFSFASASTLWCESHPFHIAQTHSHEPCSYRLLSPIMLQADRQFALSPHLTPQHFFDTDALHTPAAPSNIYMLVHLFWLY